MYVHMYAQGMACMSRSHDKLRVSVSPPTLGSEIELSLSSLTTSTLPTEPSHQLNTFESQFYLTLDEQSYKKWYTNHLLVIAHVFFLLIP